VPEAYKVSITIRSLLTPTQNLLRYSDSSNNSITTAIVSKQEATKTIKDTSPLNTFIKVTGDII
jgi:hypothetical protein